MEPKKYPSKDVHRYSRHFFLVGLIVSCSIVIMAFEWETEVTKKIDRPPMPVEPTLSLYAVPITSQSEQPSTKPKKIEKPIINLIPVEPATAQSEGPDPIPIDDEFQGLSNLLPVDLPFEEAPDTLIIAEHMPVPVGGYEGFYKQLAKSIKYPAVARRLNTEGKVYIEFVIDKNGNPVNMKVTKGIGNGCDEEAKRVIGLMKWNPGTQRGKPVLVKMTLPIYFKLN